MSKKPLLFALFFLAPPVVAWCQTAENPQKPSSYVVKKGDCLWNISKRVWGDPTKWPLLFATNETLIKNPNLIYPGQKFTIPTSITKEELRKATELAQERAVPLPAAVTGAEGHTLKTSKKREVNAAPKEPAVSSSASKLSPSTGTENKENAVNPTTPAAGTAESTGGSSKILVLIAALVALGGGLFVWFRRRNSGMLAQQPRPLSSFPQSAEPPVSKPPLSTGPQAGGQGLVAPSQGAGASGGAKLGSAVTPSMPSQPPVSRPVVTTPPAVTPAPSLESPIKPPVSTPVTPTTPPPTQPVSTTPPTPSTDKMGGFTGTITSISMSQPPAPSKAEPGTPTTPAPSASPATPSTSEDKPEDHPSGSPTGTP